MVLNSNDKLYFDQNSDSQYSYITINHPTFLEYEQTIQKYINSHNELLKPFYLNFVIFIIGQK